MASVTTCTRLVSIDVECVATGKGHNDRAPCWIGMYVINLEEKPAEPTQLLDLKVKPPVIVDYLEGITGINKKMLDNAVSLEEGLTMVYSKLGPDVILLGWNLEHDIGWLQLKEGEHYSKAVDIIDWFSHPQTNKEGRTFNRRYALGHVAEVLLKTDIRDLKGAHNPLSDALATITLFLKYRNGTSTGKSEKLLRQATHLVRTTKIADKYKSSTNPTSSGVCCFAFDESKCICGQLSKRST